jgi:hypothetical protein
VHAEGKTPQDLILSLMGSLLSLPSSTLKLLRTKTETTGKKPS